MKRWHALSPNWAITILLTLIISLNLICAYFGFFLLTKTLILAIIPLLLMLYFYKKRVMPAIFYTIFTIYFFGITLNIVDPSSLSSKLSESCYTIAYLLLIIVMIRKLKTIKFDRLVLWYLVIVFAVSTYIVLLTFTALKSNFYDILSFTLTMSKGVALLVMAFLAFAIYLSKESAQSIIFLMVVCCFVFSDILSFITTSYIHFWLFEGVQKIFQSIGLVLSCVYVFNYRESAVSGVRRKVYKPISSTSRMSVQS
ncbi:hypothetical protein [Gelidibacter maritimus]|uniref:YhhN-like protein n=1 Tax=Gelidibacter maritimus TaxID=2761487 RepID=A0A7W2M1U2_9FLAO|nr:hypothetical protein [Gelidibacter maritimus]MBA6151133.1 hypothetical protein [Gelidibacter maritimus]